MGVSKNISIKNKMRLLFLAISFSAILLGLSVILIYTVNNTREDIIENSNLHANYIAENCSAAVDFGDRKGTEDILKNVQAISEVIDCFVYDLNGNYFAGYSIHNYNPKLYHFDFKKPETKFNLNDIVVVKPIMHNNRMIGSIYLRSSIQNYQSDLKSLIMLMVAIVLIISIITLTLSDRMQRVITVPVFKLVDATKSIADKGDFSIKLEKERNDEIGILYENFNEMLHQLNKREIEKNEATVAFLQSEEKYRLAIEATNDGIWDWDVVSGSVRYSPAWSKMIGETSVPDLYSSWESRIHPDDKELVLSSLTLHLNGTTDTWEMEHRLKTSTNEWKWVKGRGTVVLRDENASPLRMVGTMMDISELKKAEEELVKAKEKAEESDHLKSAFLANMSHEIRTPMNGIIGFSQLLADPEINEDERVEYLSIINKSSYRLLSLVNDIIDISKIQTGQMEIKVDKLNLNNLMTELLDFHKSNCQQKGNALNLSVALSENDSIIFTDEQRVHQVLTNLLSNAIKFTEHGTIDFGYRVADDLITFFVKDSGTGISEEAQRYIFDRFRQADTALSRKYEGSGLGLSIANGISELLNGKVWVESELDKGSTFYFQIPYNKCDDLIDSETSSNVDKVAISNDLSDRTILIVEDDDVNFQYLKKIVNRFSKITILYDINGIEAINTVRKNPGISLIFMDIKMPFMDGLEATSLIREFNKEIPIIATTAYAMTSDRNIALAAGCTDYLSKPFEPEKVIEKIKMYIN